MDTTREQRSQIVDFMMGLDQKDSSAPSTSNSDSPRTTTTHPHEILAEIRGPLLAKYAKGQLEHGGRLWEKPVLGFMFEEIVDLVVYYSVLKEQHAEAVRRLEQAMAYGPGQPGHALECTREAYWILTRGNAAGWLYNDDPDNDDGLLRQDGHDKGGSPSPNPGGHDVPPGVERDRFDDY